MSKSRIVLLQPKAGEWEFIGVRPPDSLLAVAAAPYKEGYDVKIIDQRTDKRWKEKLKIELKNAILFGTTAMTGQQIKYALEASKFVKENSNVPVVWGGVHASLLPEQTLENKYIDIIIKGEGDFALLDIIRVIEVGKSLEGVRGVYYKEKGKIKKTAERPLIPDLDKLPNYPYELVNLKNYYGFDIEKGRSITLMTSRGCPYRCAFCYNTAYYKNTWRGISAKKTLELIERVVYDFGVKSIYFQDDNFCANVKRFEEIIDLILKRKIDISWGLLGTRINTLKYMSNNLLRKAVKAGCMDIDVGIESGSDRILNLISKDVKISEVIQVNKKLAKFFDKTKYTFIMGIPTETKQELLQSTRLALKLCKDNPHVLPLFLIYCAYPGTKLYNLAIKHGFQEPKNLEEWAEINYGTAYLRYPWLDKERIKMLKNFEFTSFFVTKNIDYKISKNYLKSFVKLYQPIAKFRFKNNFSNFLVEKKFYDIFTKK